MERGSVSGRVQNTATGQYLGNARITVKGTDITVFSDSFGTYRIVGLPPGRAELEVFYTGLDTRVIPVDVPAGGSVEQDVALTAQRYTLDPEVVQLDKFVVSESREKEGEALATNEQRFAPNIKNVLSADAVGDVLGSSVGNFLKFVPGLTGEFNSGEIVGISIRGIGGGMTSFTANGGVPKVSPFFAGGRDYHMINLSLNDISRIDITKVPTPAMAADSLGGSVDLISKSAFERDRAALRWRVNLAGNSQALSLNREPYIRYDTKKHTIFPVVDFDYTLPVSKTFGVVVTGMMSDRLYPNELSIMTFNTGGTGTGASQEAPYLRQVQLGDQQRIQTRNTLSFKADWKVSKHGVLSFTNQYNYYDNEGSGVSLFANAGAVGTPVPATGTKMTYGPNYTSGATGRGGITMAVNENTWKGQGNTSDLNYRFDDGRWKITGGLSLSRSTIDYLPIGSGHFTGINAVINRPVRVELLDYNSDRPARIRVFDNTGAEVDVHDINNYRISAASATRATNAAAVKAAHFNVRRNIDMFSFPLGMQAGGSRRIQTRDVRRERRLWTVGGVDANPATFEPAAEYQAVNYRVGSSTFDPFGPGNVPWINSTRAFEIGQNNPGRFYTTAAQDVAEEAYRRTESEYIEETVDAVYLQADARFLSNRLRVLAGVRFEKTTDEGQGSLNDPDAVFVRNATGGFARDAQGNRIRKPGSGAGGSMEELDFIMRERAALSNKTYDGYYPSLHFTYNVTDDLLLRLAYAKTYGRPSFVDIVPRTVITRTSGDSIDEDDPNFMGDLTVRNPGLMPWTADNYDLSLEYYTKHGGMLSAGVFRKDISDFFGASVRPATIEDLRDLGFDETYVGWNLRTQFNSGSARISGIEVSLRHSLDVLGGWGRHLSVFANATRLYLEGSSQADFSSFIPKSGNAGVSFNWKRLSLGAKVNYRGLDKRIGRPMFGADGYQYMKERISVDLDANFRLTPRLSIAASVNNALNEPLTILEYGSSTPEYARQQRVDWSGVQLAIGLRGHF